MRLVGETVLEGARAAFECVDNARGYQNRAEGHVATGDSLPDQDNVRLDIPVLDCEGLSGAAHAAHDFVGDEENAVLAANSCYALGVAFGRGGCAESGANYGLEDEGGYARGGIRPQQIVEIVCTGNGAVGEFFVEGTVIAEA